MTWLKKKSKPFIDTKSVPPEIIVEPEEKHRFPKEETSCPHAVDVQMEK